MQRSSFRSQGSECIERWGKSRQTSMPFYLITFHIKNYNSEIDWEEFQFIFMLDPMEVHAKIFCLWI
jgi:hypothetical protein